METQPQLIQITVTIKAVGQRTMVIDIDPDDHECYTTRGTSDDFPIGDEIAVAVLRTLARHT